MKELLIPAGNMECFKVAVHSGADAIYLAGLRFGARAYAGNFTDEELIEAIKYAHLYGVKVNVTVNTLIYESEIDDAINYLEFLYKNGVDAVIIQDIGLIYVAKKKFPNLEIHASTQVHNTNQNELNLLEDLGVKRAVFARELSVDEIDSITTSLEKEAFIHGALCISYSGECLFSSIILNRSGNRGECAQMCRLPYKLESDGKIIKTNGKFLLSPKDLNTSLSLKKVLDSSIYSLKIEGRMKSPEYVGCVTKLYRDLLDKYYRGEELTINQELYDDLELIFNRKYTKGFILNEDNFNIINNLTSNHQGVLLGKVLDVSKKYIKIKLNRELNQGDGIRFNEINEGMIANFIYNEKEKLINKGEKNSIILLDNKFDGIKKDSTINITVDTKVRDKYINYDKKYIGINIKIKAKLNNKLVLSYSDGVNSGQVEYGDISASINRPITKEDIIKHIDRLKDTAYKINSINIDMDDNIFINLKDINEIRRIMVEELNNKRTKIPYEIIINEIKDNKNIDNTKDINISVLVRNEDQLKYVLDKVDRIYVDDINLFNKYKDNNKVFFKTSRIGRDSLVERTLSTELGNLYKNHGIGDYYLNVTNHYSIDALSKYSNLITLSVELRLPEIENIMNYYNHHKNIEVVVYTLPDLMILKYDLLKNNSCNYNSSNYLIDRNNDKYKIIYDGLTHIISPKPINRFNDIERMKEIGITNFRIELLDENEKEIDNLLNKIK
ncbi:MAG: U32 family peptidase [Bacilli bacterium]|nr:U32 family peptidase [Bacilli bacterium]